MPQLVKLQEEHESSGFVIIANHVQNAEKKEVVSLLRSVKANFTVTSFSRVNLPNMPQGIPRAFLFDSKGQLVESGRPVQMKKAIKDLVDREPHWLAAGREYKKIARLAHSLKSARSYGPILKRLAKEREKEGDGALEAEYLLGRIRGYGTRLLEKASESETEDAFTADQIYKEVALKWKGDIVGTRATDRLKELKKDKEFQTELKASKIAHQIRTELEQLVAKKGDISLDYGPNRKTSSKIRSMYRMLKKKYPESSASETILGELKEYGF